MEPLYGVFQIFLWCRYRPGAGYLFPLRSPLRVWIMQPGLYAVCQQFPYIFHGGATFPRQPFNECFSFFHYVCLLFKE